MSNRRRLNLPLLGWLVFTLAMWGLVALGAHLVLFLLSAP